MVIWTFAVILLYKLRSVLNTGTCYPGQRLVCQEPGLSALAHVYLTNFCTDLNLFYSIRLFYFHSSVSLFGNFAGLPQCTVPSVIVHSTQNDAGHHTMKAPSMPC